MLQKAQADADEYIIIGTNVWEKTSEPRYVIMTFGLGHNYASIALMIDENYNQNISKDRYFNALDYDVAVKRATEIALDRGDTDSIERIQKATKIEVILPAAARCNPAQEAGEGNGLSIS